MEKTLGLFALVLPEFWDKLSDARLLTFLHLRDLLAALPEPGYDMLLDLAVRLCLSGRKARHSTLDAHARNA